MEYSINFHFIVFFIEVLIIKKNIVFHKIMFFLMFYTVQSVQINILQWINKTSKLIFSTKVVWISKVGCQTKVTCQTKAILYDFFDQKYNLIWRDVFIEKLHLDILPVIKIFTYIQSCIRKKNKKFLRQKRQSIIVYLYTKKCD